METTTFSGYLQEPEPALSSASAGESEFKSGREESPVVKHWVVHFRKRVPSKRHAQDRHATSNYTPPCTHSPDKIVCLWLGALYCLCRSKLSTALGVYKSRANLGAGAGAGEGLRGRRELRLANSVPLWCIFYFRVLFFFFSQSLSKTFACKHQRCWMKPNFNARSATCDMLN